MGPWYQSGNLHSTDHRTTGVVPVYELKEGKFNYVKTIDVKTRWPENGLRNGLDGKEGVIL